jgi:hypothetical protein
MIGHTDKKTINDRRPLTSNMRALLSSLHYRADSPKCFPHCIFPSELSQAEKNAAKALHNRDLIWWDAALSGWHLTDAGRLALSQAQSGSQP